MLRSSLYTIANIARRPPPKREAEIASIAAAFSKHTDKIVKAHVAKIQKNCGLAKPTKQYPPETPPSLVSGDEK